jgi:O-methyltransferase/methyltransferase family protein
MVKTDDRVNQTGRVPEVFRMATGYWASQSIYVAAKLGIADVVGDGSKSVDELANATGSNARSLARLLRALVALGVLAAAEDRRFRLTGIGASLQSDMPGSMRSIILTLGEDHYQAWGKLIESIKCDKPAFDEVNGRPLFEYLAENSAAAQTFNEGMTDLTSQAALAILLAYDFSGSGVVADVGGGHGVLLDRILGSNPSLAGILFDFEQVIESAPPPISRHGLVERRQSISGNFFASVPAGADVYILKNVLHDWSDERAVCILKNCRCAMRSGAKLLVIEMVLPLLDDPAFGSLLDLNMLVMSGGRERTKEEYFGLLESSGFRPIRVIPTLSPLSILEAIPV